MSPSAIMRPMPCAPPITRAVLPLRLNSPAASSKCDLLEVRAGAGSNLDDHLAEVMLVLQEQQRLLALGEREGLLDHRLHTLLGDEGQHFAEVLRIPYLAADD